MRRAIVLSAIVSLAACHAQMGSPFLPVNGGPDPARAAKRIAHVTLGVRIPPKRRYDRVHPNTISPLTQSFAIGVNGAQPAVFNATVRSGNCVSGSGGLVCTFTMTVYYGSNTFLVTTYSGRNATGSVLDQATAVVPIDASTKYVKIKLGPVVSNTNDAGPGSLRQAILDANAGDTITYLGKTPGTIVLSSGIIALTRNVTIAGPGASKLTISGNGASQIFSIAQNVTVNINGMTLTNGYSAASDGGAILNSGNLSVDGDAFTSNVIVGIYHSYATPGRRHDPREPARRPHGTAATGLGGAIYDGLPGSAGGSGSLTVTNSTFAENSALTRSYYGGAIYNAPNYTLNVSGSTFEGNSASYGGAIYTYGTATLSHDAFDGNTSQTKDAGTYDTGMGGAVLANAATTIASCAFDGNIAAGTSPAYSYSYGGAIAAQYAGILTITNSTFSTNFAGLGTNTSGTAEGGAIYNSGGGATISGSTFSQNSVSSGGNVFAAAIYGVNSLVADNDTFSNNTTTSGNSDAYGGVIYETSPLTINNSTFTGNTVTLGTYAYGGLVYAGQTLNMKSVTFSGNSVSPGSGSYAYGGLAYAIGTATLQAVQFNQNSVSIQGGTAPYVYGGILQLGGSNNSINGISFSKNRVQVNGAGSYVYGGILEDLGSSTFTGLLSADQNVVNQIGSGGYVDGGVLYLSGATIASVSITSNNTTASAGDAGYGGAIYSTGTLTLGTASTPGSTISGNTVPTEGAGMYLGSTSAVVGTTISGNGVTDPIAVGDGGGGIYNAGSLTLTASTVNGNTVSGSLAGTGGGGIDNATGTFSIVNSTIANNTSSVDGGGIENAAGTANSLVNATVYGNAAIGSGGNLMNYGSKSVMSFADTIVAGGTAATGTDAYNAGILSSNDYNLIGNAVVGGNPITGTTTHNITGVSPQLGALASNGGPTQTMADSPSSPGFNAIPLSVCVAATVTVDQRGQPRGDNGDNACDMGAYESQTP